MKKNYFLLFAFFLLLKANAQIIDFKDSNFKSKLLEANTSNKIAKDLQGNFCKIDLNGDNEIQISEAENIGWLDFYQTYIEDLTGIAYFSNLNYLEISANNISSLDVSGLKKLQTLNCGANPFKELDVSSLKDLESLSCEQNSLTSLNVNGLTKLNFLGLSYSSLSELNLSGLSNLKTLYCDQNMSLKELDLKGLTELELLDTNYDQVLLELKNISDCKKLKKINCSNGVLEKLDVTNCIDLEILSCQYNNFSSLNISGLMKLKYLEVGGLKFSSIELNTLSNIESLFLYTTSMTTLDLTNFVKIKYVDANYQEYLTKIFSKNGVVEDMTFATCPKLEYICADEGQFKQIEYYIDRYYNNDFHKINYNSYCSFGPGGVYSTIQGHAKFDQNVNGCDDNDTLFPNLNFNVTDGESKSNIITDASGNFNILVGDGTYTIKPVLENPDYFSVSPESVLVNFPAETSPFTQNFCITPNGNHQDLEIAILPINPARPGFDATYKIIYKNKGSQIKSGSVSLDFNDAVLDLVTSVPAITSQNTNKLVWNYIDLQPFESREILITLNVNSPMEIPAVNIDDRLSFTALITPIIDDEKPVDNSFALRQTVVGSFDPNDKTCLEGDVIKPELIGEYVHYLIRFENTGTYPAENIVVKDLIDLSKFDISTLVPTGSSHSYITKISNGNKVEFIFEKINLPFDDAHNDGYIAFKIKTLPTLKVGDSFTNEANIYFDYNFPILTNKATSTFKTLGTQDFEFSNYFNIYPNPVKDVLNISANNTIELKTVNIYDILGQLLIAVPNAEKTSNIDVSRLQAGNYILQVKTNKGNSSSKFIKY